MRTSSERVEQIRDEIARYRRGRSSRAHLPAALWSEAAAIARDLGTSVAARTLGVSYASLRRRVRGAEKSAFVELEMVTAPNERHAGTIELEDGRGARMTIRLDNGWIDIVALVRAFRGEP